MGRKVKWEERGDKVGEGFVSPKNLGVELRMPDPELFLRGPLRGGRGGKGKGEKGNRKGEEGQEGGKGEGEKLEQGRRLAKAGPGERRVSKPVYIGSDN